MSRSFLRPRRRPPRFRFHRRFRLRGWHSCPSANAQDRHRRNASSKTGENGPSPFRPEWSVCRRGRHETHSWDENAGLGVVVSEFAPTPISHASRLRNQNDTEDQQVANVLFDSEIRTHPIKKWSECRKQDISRGFRRRNPRAAGRHVPRCETSSRLCGPTHCGSRPRGPQSSAP